MPAPFTIRLLTLSAMVSMASVHAQIPTHAAQSTLPPAQPTAASPQGPPTAVQRPPGHAEIAYSNGTLTVTADNASLNEILHQISEKTGMKVTGGVKDERVFGQYGPAPSIEVISSLLDGTTSNVLFVAASANTPPELVLTPRNGGPTPPNPNAAAMREEPEDHEPSPQETTEEKPVREGAPNIPPPSAPADGANAGQNNTNQQESPNGVKTPQQIFQQLQQMRQQQGQQQPQQ